MMVNKDEAFQSGEKKKKTDKGVLSGTEFLRFVFGIL